MKSFFIGPLEQRVMKCVWRKEKCTTRDVWNCLNQEKVIAYNTIQTIMTRLIDKGLLKRTLQGKTHLYQAKQKKQSTLQSAISQVMSSFTNQFGDDALIAFVDGLDDISDETRQKLIKKLRNK